MDVRRTALLSSLLFPLTFPLIPVSATLAAVPAGPPPQSSLPTIKDGIARPVSASHVRASASRVPADVMKYLPGRLIVKLKGGRSPEELDPVKQKHALKLAQKKMANTTHHRFKDLYDVTAAKGADLPALAAELMQNDAVEYAEPVRLSYTRLVPNDTYYNQQWSHKNTKAESGWDITTGSSSVIVAVVDTGVAYTHPDLSANIWHDAEGNPGKDFVDIPTSAYTDAGYTLIPEEDYTGADYDPSDYNGHGTHVAGIIGAVGNNSLGVTGVCPSCRIMPVRAGFSIRIGSSDYGSLASDNIANAIMYAADNGAKVINMSFGGEASSLIADAVSYADGKGVLMVAAAGNDFTSDTSYAYPAAQANVVAVAATGNDDAKAWYSNYGSWVSVAAPGGDGADYPIYSTVPTTGSLGNSSGYAGLSGTSMASPYVAGLAGLILSKNPNLTNRQVAQILKQGVDVPNVDIPDSPTYIGTGRVNVFKALQVSTVSSATATISSPTEDFISGSAIYIRGTATGPYQVLYGSGLYPASWTVLGSGSAKSGALATLNPSTLSSPFGDYSIKLSVQDQNGKVERVVHGDIGKQFLPGWPRKFAFAPTTVWNSPNLADVDNDGYDEIIVTGRDANYFPLISIFKKDGTQVPGWPQTVPVQYAALDFGVAAGDLDGDGNIEIVAPVDDASNSSLRVYDRYGNLLWTKVLDPENSVMTVTLGDVDGDGHLEIITESYNSRLWVLDKDGNVKWSYALDEYDSIALEKTAAVADLDGNGKKEIIKNVVKNIKFDDGDTARTMGGALMVFNPDGSVRWTHQWPEPGEDLTAQYYEIYPTGSPVVADINNDGSPEIIVKVNVWKGNDVENTEWTTRFYAFDVNGSILPGWPVTAENGASFGEMAAGDLAGDGYREVVASSASQLLAIRHTGALLFPPISMYDTGNLSIADVTGDGRPDIVAYDGTSFKVIESNGAVSTLPITARNTGSNVHNQPILTDLDKSGTEKLIFIDNGDRPIVWAWDLQVPHVAQAEQWTLFGFDAMHSGVLRSPSLSPVSIATATLPDGMIGTAYNLSLAASGGIPPYTWSITKGSLPSGFTFDGSTGLLSGTPMVVGGTTFTVRAIDAQAASAIKSFSLSAVGLPPALVVGSNSYFSGLQQAYDNCADGDIIQLQGVSFNEAPLFARDITFTLKGGYDDSFGANNGRTSVKGCMTIKNGKLKVSNIVFN